MRLILALFLIAPAFAQQPPEPPKPAEQAKPAAEAAQAPATPEEKPADSPAPSTESWVNGYVDFGYRWRTDVRGSFNQYRSIVNLGEGPKLFGVDLSFAGSEEAGFRPVGRAGFRLGRRSL